LFNPLYLQSTTGQGKTHLMQAIAQDFALIRPDANILYLPAEKFMLQFVAAVRAQDTIGFKARIRAADMLLIDDLQFIIGKNSTQEELLHTVDDLLSSGKRLIVAADRAPNFLEGLDQRLLSRLGSGLVAEIDAPDFGLRTAILEQRRALMPEVDVPAEVIEFLAKNVTRNVRELEGAFNKLVGYASLAGATVNMDLARVRLSESLRSSRARITIDDIQQAVCAHYRLDRSEMASQRRSRVVARPRQVAMYLAKTLTPRSYPEIGRKFGGRDHSTVIHAIRTIEGLRTRDSDLDADIVRIRRVLEL
jgi:chromosomal replication initiator protein